MRSVVGALLFFCGCASARAAVPVALARAGKSKRARTTTVDVFLAGTLLLINTPFFLRFEGYLRPTTTGTYYVSFFLFFFVVCVGGDREIGGSIVVWCAVVCLRRCTGTHVLLLKLPCYSLSPFW